MEVERSNDTQDWISVYRTNGAGNSLEETTYEGIDFNVPKVPLYYRLKQVDYDGDRIYQRTSENCRQFPRKDYF